MIKKLVKGTKIPKNTDEFIVKTQIIRTYCSLVGLAVGAVGLLLSLINLVILLVKVV